MRKFFTSSLIGLALLAGIPYVAQAQCLLCGIIGYTIGSSSGARGDAPMPGAGLSGDVLYIMPRVGERVTDPLGVRQVSGYFETRGGFWNDGRSIHRGPSTIRELFAGLIHAESYEILSVQRYLIPSGSDRGMAMFLFTYIEKDKVTQIDKLPSLGERRN